MPPVAEAKYDQPDFSELEKPADYDSGELPPVDVDSPEMFMQAQVAKRAAVKKIEVQGRNWWRRGAGGNYFKAYIYVNDQLVHVTPEQGGGSEMYLTAARDWLHKNGYIDTDRRTPLWQLREKGIEFVYGAVDVRRERDL